MFRGLFKMHETCLHCALRFEREPGYFLGSIYINYGAMAVLMTLGWVVLRYGLDVERKPAAAALSVFCILFGVLFFRYARALWLALDCRFDRELFAERDLPASGDPHGRP